MHHKIELVRDKSMYLIIDTDDDRVIKQIVFNCSTATALEKTLKAMYQHYQKIDNIDSLGYHICSICHMKTHIGDFKFHYIFWKHERDLQIHKRKHLKEIRDFNLNYRLGSYAPFNYS